MAQSNLEQQVDELRSRLAEYEILLREADHRVKNSLQLVASMLSIHARQVGDGHAAKVLDNACRRVLSIAAVHEQFYRCRGGDQIDLQEFLHGLGASLAQNKPDNVTDLVMNVASIPASPGFAEKLGLLVNELVTNAFKHAYPPGGYGVVRVLLTGDAHGCRLIVEDDGVGLSGDLGDSTVKSFGSIFLRSIIAQMDGAMEVGNDPGLTVVVDLPGPPGESRHAQR